MSTGSQTASEYKVYPNLNKYCHCPVSSDIELKCQCQKNKLDLRVLKGREGRKEGWRKRGEGEEEEKQGGKWGKAEEGKEGRRRSEGKEKKEGRKWEEGRKVKKEEREEKEERE